MRTSAQKKLIAERTRAGLDAARARGVKLGNPRLPSDLSALTPLAVRQIKQAADEFAWGLFPVVYELLRHGWTMTAIAAEFNKRGIRTRRNRKWYAATVRNILLRSGATPKRIGIALNYCSVGLPVSMAFLEGDEGDAPTSFNFEPRK